ncbi:hypothetical protein [Streptomyces sp. NPDC048224]|uniref:hypothetical protein n=1 Tax=Streptomyces sp. NPDC048224 TaxID=3154500 RepID=UPI003407D730
MNSMAALAADTTPPPTIGGSGLLLGLLVVGILFSKSRGTTTDTPSGRTGKLRSTWSALVSLARSVWGIIRFYGGREMRGEPRSTATFWRSGVLLAKPAGTPAPAVAMASVAVAPPRVSLVKKPRRQPSPWARRAASWIETYRGRGAAALDRIVRTALWTARTAGRVWRFLKAIWAGLRAVYAFVAPIVATLTRVTRMWHCWPYAARGLARLAMTAAALGLLVPAWRGWTLTGLALAAGTAVVLAHKHRPKPPGDDAVYGPRLWAILRHDLDLPDDEPREQWLLLPERLAADGARIVLRLPWTFRGSEIERSQVTDLINSRIPGEWQGRYSFTGETFTAVYTHKPPPKPKEPDPECPESVDFFADDIQEAIASCKVGEVVLGRDQDQSIIIRRLDGETPHWALSVGTGGGKSTFNMSVAVQLIAQGYHIIVIDPKRSSVKPLEGIPGVHIYGDPKNPQDMREAIEWFKDEIDARSYVKDKDETREFPGLLLLIEEANEFADISKEWWDDNRKTKDDEDGPKDRAADTVWGDVASSARLGRFVRGNILAVFQDLRDQALGGKGLRNLFRLKFMGNYTVNQWKNVIGTTPVPDSVNKAGRMMIVEGNSNLWVQTLYGPGSQLREWALKHREEQGFDPRAGLFGSPPERSPERMPYLVRVASRDDSANSPQGPSEGGLGDNTAGRVSHNGADVTAQEADVTGPRDRLRLIPGQAGHDGPQAPAHDPTAPPELLPLAEVARRVGPDQGVPKYDTLRQHKARRDDFPKGVEISGKEHFTVAQIVAYYAPQENRA